MNASQIVISICLLVAGVIHILPISGLFGASRLEALYGVAIQDPNLLILMRHRAVLFLLLGLFIVAAIFIPAIQLAAIIAGLVSAVLFIVLAKSVGDYNSAIAKVVLADWVAIAALVLALLLHCVNLAPSS